METIFYTGAVILIAVGFTHSYIGERYILTRLFRRGEFPKLFIEAEFTVRTLRFEWHITSIVWIGFFALFLILANHSATDQILNGSLEGIFLATTATIFVGSRGRYLAWIAFLITGGLALYAARNNMELNGTGFHFVPSIPFAML